MKCGARGGELSTRGKSFSLGLPGLGETRADWEVALAGRSTGQVFQSYGSCSARVTCPIIFLIYDYRVCI